MKRTALTTFKFAEEVCIPQAQPRLRSNVRLDSSALDVMTDLAVVKAESILPSLSLEDTEQAMINRGVRSLFVASEYPCVDGLITAADLLGDRPLKIQNSLKLQQQDLRAVHLMTPLKALDLVDYDEIKESQVGHVLETFYLLRCTHLIVVQRARIEGPARIRGVISLTQVNRQMALKEGHD